MESPDILSRLIFAIFDGISYIGPIVVGILVVPIYGYFKKFVTLVDSWPAYIQQIVVAAFAGLMTWLGTHLNIVLPTDMALFGEPQISALLSSAIAFGVHAGKKAKTGKA
jgi:hypothetical protein